MKFLRTHFLTEHLRWLLLYKAFNKIEHFFRYNKINFIDLMGTDDDEIVKARSLLVVIIKACYLQARGCRYVRSSNMFQHDTKIHADIIFVLPITVHMMRPYLNLEDLISITSSA